MAPEDEFYIAWDGREYAGHPPQGWFLAADNRWWPPRDMIDGGESLETGEEPEVGFGYDEGHTEYGVPEYPAPGRSPQAQQTPPPPSSGPGEHPGGPGFDPSLAGPAQNPPADWAPTPTGGAPGEPQPPIRRSAPTGGGRSRQRRGRRNRFRLGPVLLFFFILSRCNAFEEVQDAFSAGPDLTGFTEAAAADFTTTDGCSNTFLWGSLTNDTAVRQTYIVTTARQGGGTDYQSEELSIGAGETRSWVINFPSEDESSDFCPPIVVLVANP